MTPDCEDPGRPAISIAWPRVSGVGDSPALEGTGWIIPDSPTEDLLEGSSVPGGGMIPLSTSSDPLPLLLLLRLLGPECFLASITGEGGAGEESGRGEDEEGDGKGTPLENCISLFVELARSVESGGFEISSVSFCFPMGEFK